MIDTARRAAQIMIAAFTAVTFVVQFYNDDVPLAALFSSWVLIALLVWEVIDYHLRPKPDVRFAGYSPVSGQPVTFAERGPQGVRIVDQKLADFCRVNFINQALDPVGAASTALALSARVIVRTMKGEVADEWQGRWANIEEAYEASKKWELDRIDLPANGQEATLDLVMRYQGTTAAIGWDNSVASGKARVTELSEPEYEIEVRLRSANIRRRSLFFRLRNTSDDFAVGLIGNRSRVVLK